MEIFKNRLAAIQILFFQEKMASGFHLRLGSTQIISFMMLGVPLAAAALSIDHAFRIGSGATFLASEAVIPALQTKETIPLRYRISAWGVWCAALVAVMTMEIRARQPGRYRRVYLCLVLIFGRIVQESLAKGDGLSTTERVLVYGPLSIAVATYSGCWSAWSLGPE